MASRPDFVIAGVQKCGTTSLFRAMRRHPAFKTPRAKELHYFDRFYDRGPTWYAEQFPELKNGQITGEATPAYSYSPTARERMIADLPDVPVIMILRDPVSRAYSHYWHSRRNVETLPTFEDAIAAEPERMQTAGWRNRARWSYLDRGYYLRDLRPLADAYGDRLMVSTLEDLTADPQAEIARAMRHVGLDPAEAKSLEMPQSNRFTTVSRKEAQQRRKAGMPVHSEQDKRPSLSPQTREELMDLFAEPDAELLAWLGWERLPWRSRANPPAVQPVAADGP